MVRKIFLAAALSTARRIEVKNFFHFKQCAVSKMSWCPYKGYVEILDLSCVYLAEKLMHQ